jgi:hypothetical protein
MRSRICLLGMRSEHLSSSMWMWLRSEGGIWHCDEANCRTLFSMGISVHVSPLLCRFRIRMGLPLELG